MGRLRPPLPMGFGFAQITGAYGTVNEDDPYADYLLLSGDTLVVLRILCQVLDPHRHYCGKVKLIYINPTVQRRADLRALGRLVGTLNLALSIGMVIRWQGLSMGWKSRSVSLIGSVSNL